MSRRDETGDIVDMAICMVIEQAVAEPNELQYAERLGNRHLDLGLIHTRISVWIEQALSGCQQAACAVRINAPAFQNHRVLRNRNAFVLRNGRRRFRVAWHQVLSAPAIEAEGLRAARIARSCNDWPGVAHPDVTGRNSADLSAITYGCTRRCLGFI